jgi:serine/threonine-protein kinase
MAHTDPLLRPDARFARFTIEGEIGAGGMGRVFRAHDPTLRRAVAIKVLRNAGPAAQGALIAEARSVSRLNHPNICTIYEAGEVDGTPFIAMELVEGRPLSSQLSHGRMTEADVVRLALQIAAALAHAHARGIVHGDLKGENAMVTPAGAVKLLDFGLARMLEPVSFESLTRTPESAQAALGVAGTLPYMAPEILKGAPAKPTADVWAFGVLVYEMLAGARPFSGQTNFELADAILNAPPAPLPPATSQPLAAIVGRCLQKDPSLRYATAADVLLALEPLGSGSIAIGSPLAPPRSALPRRVAIPVLVLMAILGGAGAFWWQARPAVAPEVVRAPITSLMVRPFENTSGNAAEDYFAEGMTDALITDLSRIPGLKVISRTSSARYKGAPVQQIARELGVGAIVDGSVLRADDQVRISVTLVDATSDSNLWADDYTHTIQDVLALQADVARAVADELRSSFLPADQTRFAAAAPIHPAALEEYLKGRHQWNRRTPDSLLQAVAHFRQAVALKPDYAEAHAGLAQSLVLLPAFPISAMAPAATLPHARTAAERAIALDDRLAEAHAALAYVRFHALEWAAAEESFERALAMNQNYATAHFWYAAFLGASGRFPEAIAEAERAQALDPVSPIILSGTSWMHHLSRRFDKAVELAQASLALDPAFMMGHYRLGEGLLHQGRLPEAIAALEQARALSDGSPDLVAATAAAYARAGRQQEARDALRTLTALRTAKTRYVSAYALALIHTALGDRDEAFAWLDRAVEERAWGVGLVGQEADFDPLRSDPRFAVLTARIFATARR